MRLVAIQPRKVRSLFRVTTTVALPLILGAILGSSKGFGQESPSQPDAGQRQSSVASYPAGFRRVLIEPSGLEDQRRFQLPDRFIFSASDTLTVGGQIWPRGEAYTLDYDTGQLTLKQAYSDSLPIQVRYYCLPVVLQPTYALRPLVITRTLEDSTAQRPATLTLLDRTPKDMATTSLWVSGSKTFGLTVGSNRDASLQQALRIEISGQPTEGIEVVGILSDQNTPIQPEGNTQTLDEIDNVLLQVKSKHFTTTMGDYLYVAEDGAFSRYNRKLQGLQAEFDLGDHQLVIAGASYKGTFNTNAFTGIEGNQGPYQLTSKEGSRAIVVLAGTERIWVDGEAMIRGESNDYVIDYSSAQITFTRNRLITGESRIVVDFEYADQRFRRNFYATQSRLRFWQGRARLGFHYVREGDDKGNPLDILITPEFKAILENAGNDPDRAVAPGARMVGPGQGRYVIRQDGSEGEDYFEYVGPGEGTHEVSFAQVNPSEGAYRFLGGSIYQYVGPGNGNYAPVIRLPMPSVQSLMDLNLQLQPTDRFEVTGELALSNRDLNTFSQVDDGGNNTGQARRFALRLLPTSLKLGTRSLGRFAVRLQYRHLGPRFVPFGRIDEVEFDRRYDQGKEGASQGQLLESYLSHEFGQALKVDAGFGRFGRATGFRSTRREFNITLHPTGFPRTQYRVEVINSLGNRASLPGGQPAPGGSRRGRWVRHRWSGEGRFYGWRLFANLDQEHQQQASGDSLDWGRDFMEMKSGINLDRWGPLYLTTEVGFRQDDVVAPLARGGRGWVDESSARTFRQEIGLRPWHSTSSRLSLIRRHKVFHDLTGENNAESLADFQFETSPLNRAFTATFRYELNSIRSAQQLRRYIWVGRGNGNYIQDEGTGEFVFDADGDYILRLERVGDFVPTVGAKTSLRLQITPYRHLQTASHWGLRLLRGIAAETFIAAEDQRRAQRSGLPLVPLFGASNADSTTVRARFSFRQDVNLLPRNRQRSIRLRYQRSENVANQFVTGGESRLRDEQSVRIRWPLLPGTITEVEVKHSHRVREEAGRFGYNITGYASQVSLAYRPVQAWELVLKSTGGWDHDRAADFTARYWSLAPQLSRFFTGRGRWSMGLDWTRVWPVGSAQIFSPEMVRGRRPGQNFRWRLGVDYQVNRYVSAFVSYNGRKEPGRDTLHLGRAELRAFF